MVYSFGGIHQLGKVYTSGASSIIRTLTKIVDATYTIYKDTVQQNEGGSPGEYAIDITTGIVTFVPDIQGTASNITQANPGVITDSSHGLTGTPTIELSNIVGMTELNGQTVTVTVIDSNSFSIGVDTTSYTPYTSGGTWKKFAQSGEVYTYAAEFDIPVRFGIDQMRVTIDSYNNFSWGQIPLVELRESA